MSEILSVLLRASERAACIARSACSDLSSEAFLVAEKEVGEANTRFAADFKTIADVLAQESAKHEIATAFPELADNVRGEECSEIGGINISIKSDADKTAQHLSSIVPLNAAECMAKAVHCEINLDLCKSLSTDLPNVKPEEIGVWIDPIDATAEFIAGVRGEADAERGLPCVTVLIGAYLKATGDPIIGVINQPFYDKGKGRLVWGFCHNDVSRCGGSHDVAPPPNNIILMSAAENSELVQKINSLGWEVKSVPGAGHKLLKVALGEAAAYIVSKGTTFRWDTCAPHSILRAKGGDVLNYLTKASITYNDPQDCDTQEYCNSGGLIAYSDKSVLKKMKHIFD